MTTTEQKRANLKALADYLDTGITEYEFGMADFWTENDCGTVACAVGHAPFVLGLEKPSGHYSWLHFGEEHLVDSKNCMGTAKIGGWMFSGGWENTDNTARGAAARIYWYLEHGVPDDWRDQMLGRAPLCYTVKPRPVVTPAKERV